MQVNVVLGESEALGDLNDGDEFGCLSDLDIAGYWGNSLDGHLYLLEYVYDVCVTFVY